MGPRGGGLTALQEPTLIVILVLLKSLWAQQLSSSVFAWPFAQVCPVWPFFQDVLEPIATDEVNKALPIRFG